MNHPHGMDNVTKFRSHCFLWSGDCSLVVICCAGMIMCTCDGTSSSRGNGCSKFWHVQFWTWVVFNINLMSFPFSKQFWRTSVLLFTPLIFLISYTRQSHYLHIWVRHLPNSWQPPRGQYHYRWPSFISLVTLPILPIHIILGPWVQDKDDSHSCQTFHSSDTIYKELPVRLWEEKVKMKHNNFVRNTLVSF